jgi:SAM-dependent methyltransferase
MAEPEITTQLEQMRRDWDQRARENARYYVATGRENWGDEEFFRSGQMEVENQILNDLENICQGKNPRKMKVLEIGCGAGRVTRALAAFFGAVYAVDISAEMVAQARRALEGFPNAHFFQNDGKDLAVVGCALEGGWLRRLYRRFRGWAPSGHGQIDFAFSCIVFQHIPSREIIENYVREVHGLLRPGGLFKFQVQGYPEVETKPDDSWVGVSFTEEQARDMAERCGFEMRYNHGAGDQYYWLWFFKR